MHPVMSDTKWNELHLAMYGLGEVRPLWRVRDIETGFESRWDGEWFYHFIEGGFKTIEWVEIQVTSPEQDAAVLSILESIHVPGRRTENGYKIYGYVRTFDGLDYL